MPAPQGQGMPRSPLCVQNLAQGLAQMLGKYLLNELNAYSRVLSHSLAGQKAPNPKLDRLLFLPRQALPCTRCPKGGQTSGSDLSAP